jgi:hypothetical protein
MVTLMVKGLLKKLVKLAPYLDLKLEVMKFVEFMLLFEMI